MRTLVGERTTDMTFGHVMMASVMHLNDNDVKYLSAYTRSVVIEP